MAHGSDVETAASDHSASFPTVRGAARSTQPSSGAARSPMAQAASGRCGSLRSAMAQRAHSRGAHRLRSPVSNSRRKGDTASGRPVHSASTSRPTAGVWNGCSILHGQHGPSGIARSIFPGFHRLTTAGATTRRQRTLRTGGVVVYKAKTSL